MNPRLSSLFEGPLRSVHGCLHFFFPAVRHVQVHLPRGGVVAVDVTAARYELPVDKVLEYLHRRHLTISAARHLT